MNKIKFECLNCGNSSDVELKDVLEDDFGKYANCDVCESTSDLTI